MARFRNERDPRTVGRELGVELVVEGTVQSAGPAVRVSIRLLEAQSGTQVWSGRFEYASTDAFELQDRLVPRIAEELRGEVVLSAWRASTPPEALALYRQADSKLHTAFRGGHDGGPRELLESCLELAPDFLPAVALHAIASLRAWFMGRKDAQRDHAAAARASVERALRLAPEMAMTHLARAMLSVQADDWRTAVMALRTALDIAPSHAPTLQYLGSLQCEAGRADEGLVRLRLAYELSPDAGDGAVRAGPLQRAARQDGGLPVGAGAAARVAPHRTVAESLRAPCRRVDPGHRGAAAVHGRRRRGSRLHLRHDGPLCRRGAGRGECARADSHVREALSRTNSPRFASLMCQIATEILGLCGHAEQALGYFRRAAETALIDLEWIERCPALAPLRTLPGFVEGRRQVRARVEAIWLA